MALAEQVKKGGPYTKKEQDNRRQEVFRLHFEKGYSAVRISEMLNVNRNTINEDIRYWYSQLAQELKNEDLVSWLIKQFHRLESQRNRLVDELEKQDNIHNKLAIEKLLFHIDDRLAQFVSKIISNNIIFSYTKNDYEIMNRTKEIAKYLLLYDDIQYDDMWSKQDLFYNIIGKYKCDVAYTNAILSNMERLGLELCRPIPNSERYNILQFATMNGFLSDKEIQHVFKRIQAKRKQEEKEDLELQRREKLSESDGS